MQALKASYLLISLIFLNTVWANIPTVESIFRHAYNGEATSPSITIKAQLNEVSEDKESITGRPLFIEWDLVKKSGEQLQISQKKFHASQMDSASLLNIKTNSDFKWSKSASEANIDQQLFFSILTYLLFNESKPITTLLAIYNDDFAPNQKLINSEKLNFLKRKIDGSQNKTADSSVMGRRAQQISNQNLLVNNGQIKYGLDSDQQLKKFMKLRNVEAIFSNETNQLERLDWKSQSHSLSLTLKEYLLFDGVHSFPKYIIFHTSNKKVYSLRFLALEHKVPLPSTSQVTAESEFSAPFLL